jgi:hypothetical protein
MYVGERTWLERGPVGLGLYPTLADGTTPNPCFDPNRPSWMPYWIDDSTESACYYDTDSLSGQVAGAATQMSSVVGATAGGLVSGAVGGAAQGIGSSLSGTAVLIGAAVIAGIVLLGAVR